MYLSIRVSAFLRFTVNKIREWSHPYGRHSKGRSLERRIRTCVEYFFPSNGWNISSGKLKSNHKEQSFMKEVNWTLDGGVTCRSDGLENSKIRGWIKRWLNS